MDSFFELLLFKRRCPFGDGHDGFRAKARATFGHLAFYTTLSALALSGVMPFG